MGMARAAWGITPGGSKVELFTLSNKAGMEVSVANYGGVVTRLTVPDRGGELADVVLGYDTLDAYLTDCCYMGCIVGRVANRISNARIALKGKEFALDRNHGEHHLHGGSQGFHTGVWDAVVEERPEGPCLSLTRTSWDGEQGYPGKLQVRVDYILTDTGLRLEFSAATDKPTVVSMTNHSYFNLSGDPGSDCLEHELTIPAGRFLETDGEQVPTGVLVDVAGTPMDFRSPAVIGSRIDANHGPLSIGKGYDHYYVLDDDSVGLKLGATAYEPVTGRGMEVWTDHPGLQFYSGNHIPKSLAGKGGIVYDSRCGFCLEAHGYVDAPNQPGFPAVTLRPGEVYSRVIEYRFFTR